MTLDDLQFGNKLGRGAHGEVSVVTFSDRVLNGKFRGHKEAVAKRISEHHIAKNEIDKLKRVNHPNIIRLLEVITITDLMPPYEDMYYIIMERGEMSLFEYLGDASKPLSIELKYKWGLSAADAVCYLHKNNIVHRDLKPQNCIIFNDDILKLCDFGISREAFSTMTTKGHGTYVYLAPETDEDNPENKGHKLIFSFKSDVYQIGCLLWDMFAGDLLPLPPYIEFPETKGAVSQIYDLLIMCFKCDPHERPDMAYVHEYLKSCQNKHSKEFAFCDESTFI